MTYQDKLNRNVARTLMLGFFQVFLVILPVVVPFFQSKGLSMQDVFMLQALFGLVVLVTEVPSGYFADVLGRKATLVVGAIVAGVGQSLLLVADGFWTLALFEICLGIAHSLISGADLALLYDTELALGRDEDEQRQVVGKLYGARTMSEALAGVVCTVVLLYASMEDVDLRPGAGRLGAGPAGAAHRRATGRAHGERGPHGEHGRDPTLPVGSFVGAPVRPVGAVGVEPDHVLRGVAAAEALGDPGYRACALRLAVGISDAAGRASGTLCASPRGAGGRRAACCCSSA